MSGFGKGIARVWRRVARAYRMACAREDALRHRLRVPPGVWICECGRVLWDEKEFAEHARTHAP